MDEYHYSDEDAEAFFVAQYADPHADPEDRITDARDLWTRLLESDFLLDDLISMLTAALDKGWNDHRKENA